MLDDLLLNRRQTLVVGCQLGDKAFEFLGVGELEILLAQDGDVLTRLRKALLRSAALDVEVHFADRAGIDRRVVEDLMKLFVFLLVCHGVSSLISILSS